MTLTHIDVMDDGPLDAPTLRAEMADLLANHPLGEGSVQNTYLALAVGHLDRIATALERLAYGAVDVGHDAADDV